MSEIMLQAVLRMPPELWNDSPLDVAQRHSRYVQAADEIDKLRAAVEALAALVQRDRVALYEAHHYPHSGEIDDEGREALAEYDAALALADQALGSE